MERDQSEFHPLSEEYLKTKDLAYRKSKGQYFTPRSVREELIKHLPNKPFMNILDPSCGSGEFLMSAQKNYPDAKLTGWEIDKELANISKKVCPSATICNMDALTSSTDKKFDLIVGNPPYFEFRPEKEIKEKYRPVINGRSNIFSMFIKLGMDLLTNNGCLAFVVPPSMNNGAYFRNLRKYITESADIHHLSILDSPSIFHQAQQKVMVIILIKEKNSEKYVFSRNGITIFSPKVTTLRKEFQGKTSLFESGFSVRTGPIVWNQNREILCDSAQNATRLIWAHNILKNKLIYENSKKPQFIKKISPLIGPAIVVNRIVGSGHQVNLKAAVVKKSEKFLAENHVNMIFPPTKLNGKAVPFSLLKSIARQISSDETAQIIRIISGNTQLSKSELWKLLPLEIV